MSMGYCISKRTIVNAGISTVFNVLADIENWHLWTKSVTKITYRGNNKFKVGSKAHVVQPRLSSLVWTITEIIPNRCFIWQTGGYGVKMIAKHTLKETDQGTFIEHRVIYKGLFAWLIYKLTARLTNLYLAMEINGLKNNCERVEQNISAGQ